VEASIDYLGLQVEAGADALQIFDSWAGSLPDDEFARWVVEPTKRIVSELTARFPHVPIIGFPRGAGIASVGYAAATGVAGIGCDTAMSVGVMRDQLAAKGIVVQGNLDPLLLVAGSEAMARRVNEILDVMQGQKFVFNLGHGIVPETPPGHVAELVRLIRGHARP